MHSKKARDSIDVTSSWISIDDKLLHLKNNEFEIVVTFGGIAKYCKFEHSKNTLDPIDVILSWNSTDNKLEHWLNK